MNRFFVDKVKAEDKYIILNDPTQLHHLRDVLRIKPLELVAVFDNFGNEYITVVNEIGNEAVKLEVKEKRSPKDLGVSVTVACAIPKKVKMDDIVDKLTQLGVACIIPLQTERVIVKLDQQKKLQRLQRWEKIAESAVKQSQRSKFVEIKPFTDFKELIANAQDFDLKLIPTLEGERRTLRDVLNVCHSERSPKGEAKNLDVDEILQSAVGLLQDDKLPRKIIVLIGPEGDFTPLEIDLAKKAGFLLVSLGPHVLRVDTAAIAVVSFIKLNEPRTF